MKISEIISAKLLNDPSTRVATDPVSGNQVDKALAIIGECDKKAYYFLGCSDSQYNHLNPNNLIQWEVIKFLLDNNEQAIMGNIAFLAPGISIEPLRSAFPKIFNLSIGFFSF